MKKLILVLLFCLVPLKSHSKSVEEYTWNVTRVIDGDTFEVDAMFYPPELGKIKIRVLGIDTPEKNPRAKCDYENRLAQGAHRFAVVKLNKKTVTIKNIKQDKYGTRIVADVYIDGKSFADTMIKQGFAVKYDGRTKKSWCN